MAGGVTVGGGVDDGWGEGVSFIIGKSGQTSFFFFQVYPRLWMKMMGDDDAMWAK